MEEIKLLLEDYKRRLATAREMLNKIPFANEKSEKCIRLLAKTNGYQTVISDLEHVIKAMENNPTPSLKMKEFIGKVDKLCFEYGYEILPSSDYDEEFGNTLIITDGKLDTTRLTRLDGDGGGK